MFSGMKIEVNISKRYFLVLLGLLVVLFGALFVYATTYSSVPANFVGHVADFVWVKTPDGSEMSLQQAIDNGKLVAEGIVCPVTPNYDSSLGSTWQVIDVPDGNPASEPSCIGDDVGCVIKQEVYDATGLKVRRQYSYSQQFTASATDAETWWSSFSTGGNSKNGDSVQTRILPKYNDGNIELFDDSSAQGETNSTRWVAKDSSGQYYQKIYICSYT